MCHVRGFGAFTTVISFNFQNCTSMRMTTMPNARDDHKTAQHKTQYIKQQEEECHLPGVSQKRGCVGRGTPLFCEVSEVLGAVFCGVTAWLEPAIPSESILANGLQRCGGVVESKRWSCGVGRWWNPRLLLRQALQWPLREFVSPRHW